MSTASMVPIPRKKYTVAEYLALERAAEERHVYLDGDIFAMAGESLPHAIISTNLVALLVAQLKGTPCFAVSKDTKVRSGLGTTSLRSVKGMFSYPDIMVVCGEPQYFDDQGDVIMNPTAIVEVLSPATELFDRSEKFQRYRNWNTTLTDYLLVSQTRPLIEHYRRQADNSWTLQEQAGLEASVSIASINCTLKLSDVYDRIPFPDEATP